MYVMGVNSMVFISSSAAIIFALFWNLECKQPLYTYLGLVCVQSIINSFYFFLIWNAKLASDQQWVRHLLVVTCMSAIQISTATWGLQLVIYSSPQYEKPADTMDRGLAQDVTVAEKLCWRDSRTLFYNTTLCTLVYLGLVCFTSYTLYMRFIPSLLKQTRDHWDYR